MVIFCSKFQHVFLSKSFFFCFNPDFFSSPVSSAMSFSSSSVPSSECHLWCPYIWDSQATFAFLSICPNWDLFWWTDLFQRVLLKLDQTGIQLSQNKSYRINSKTKNWQKHGAYHQGVSWPLRCSYNKACHIVSSKLYLFLCHSPFLWFYQISLR